MTKHIITQENHILDLYNPLSLSRLCSNLGGVTISSLDEYKDLFDF
jgi:hypothetical protein